MPDTNAHIVQLPFPAVRTPHAHVVDYYLDYSRLFNEYVDGYFIPSGSLWEMPLWVAHLSGMLKHIGYQPKFIDLTHVASTVEDCTRELLALTETNEALLLSPLAQNFALALAVSSRLMVEGRRTLLGGNMATLAKKGDATVIHGGRATPQSLRAAMAGVPNVGDGLMDRDTTDWLPDYDLLRTYNGKVPLLRLNASHGCLYACEFCGDAWSRTLSVVPPAVLEQEVQQFERLFPDTRLIYIGDKTFGQSQRAVQNLLDVFAGRPNFKFVVQTHVLAINDEVLDAMERLGVVVVELGFESASIELLKDNRKLNRSLDFYLDQINRLASRDMRVVLNVLSGLPTEDRASHSQTVSFIRDAPPEVWLYNLYNYVPYPLTPHFGKMRNRIVDWDFANWREDAPPVFEPYHCSREESFEFFLEKVRAAHIAIRRNETRSGRGCGQANRKALR